MFLSEQKSETVSRLPGNTLSEYALIGGVVLLVSLGGLLLLGTNVQGSFQNFKQSLKREPPITQTAQVPPVGQGASDSINAGDLNFQTSTGTPFQLQNYQQDMSTAIITAGANGATEIILANLESLISQLLASNEITQEQANLLTALANQGHTIAEVEEAMEAALDNSSIDISTLEHTPIPYQGTNVPARELYARIGTYDNVTSGIYIQKFKDLKAQAEAQGALDDPIVNQVVTLMSQQIISLANGMESGLVYLGMYQLPLNEYATYAAMYTKLEVEPLDTNLLELTSTITHQDSGSICTVGGETDSGTACGSTP